MPRKKKIEAAEEIGQSAEQEADKSKELDKEIDKEVEKIASFLEEAEEEDNVSVDAAVEEKKKKEIKLLSEKELKKIMTDTKETLVPLTDYIRCSMHLGTKVITPDMRRYVYKRRADGLAVINTNMLDAKLREAVEFLKKYEPQDVFIACKREAGWSAVKKFSEILGIRAFTKKYPAGIITNPVLDNFFEVKAVIICDPWVDKNALNDAVNVKIPVLAICDTNNYHSGVTQVIVGNNKSGKSIGLALYVLAREYLKAKGKASEAKALNMKDFTGELGEPFEVSVEKVEYGV